MLTQVRSHHTCLAGPDHCSGGIEGGIHVSDGPSQRDIAGIAVGSRCSHVKSPEWRVKGSRAGTVVWTAVVRSPTRVHAKISNLVPLVAPD